jgi:ribosomal protein S18 acetylase RimI-like enzyme
VGFAICRLLVRTNVISIDKIGVHPKYRQCGIGTLLINHIKAIGLPIKLDVVATNKTAINFYLKNQFKVIGSKVLGKDIEVLIMST